MALLNEIQKWTETLADYQRDAARRLLQNDAGLAQEDLKSYGRTQTYLFH